MNTFIWLLIPGVLLHVARRVWMGYQVRPAVIRTFNLESAADVIVKEAHWFCGRDSIKGAFLYALCTRYYHVRWKTAEGKEGAVDLEIHFHLASGTLRKIDVMNLQRASDAGFHNLS